MIDPEVWHEVTTRAAAQHGLVTTPQAEACGLGLRMRRRAVERALLHPVRRNVFVVQGVPSTVWQPLMAAVLAAGPDAFASRRAAGGLFGAPGFLEGQAEITVVGRRPKLDGVAVHRTDLWHPDDAAERLGVPVTSAARLVLDAATWLPEFRVAKVLDHVRRRHLCDLDDVVACWERLRGQPRNGSLVVEALLAERINGIRAGDSDWEVDLVKFFLASDVEPPVQQFQVVADGRVYLIDLAWPGAKVGVEFLGFDVHATRTAFDHDADRTARLSGVGWVLVPATARSNHYTVLRSVKRLLHSRRPRS